MGTDVRSIRWIFSLCENPRTISNSFVFQISIFWSHVCLCHNKDIYCVSWLPHLRLVLYRGKGLNNIAYRSARGGEHPRYLKLCLALSYAPMHTTRLGKILRTPTAAATDEYFVAALSRVVSQHLVFDCWVLSWSISKSVD